MIGDFHFSLILSIPKMWLDFSLNANKSELYTDWSSGGKFSPNLLHNSDLILRLFMTKNGKTGIVAGFCKSLTHPP